LIVIKSRRYTMIASEDRDLQPNQEMKAVDVRDVKVAA